MFVAVFGGAFGPVQAAFLEEDNGGAAAFAVFGGAFAEVHAHTAVIDMVVEHPKVGVIPVAAIDGAEADADGGEGFPRTFALSAGGV